MLHHHPLTAFCSFPKSGVTRPVPSSFGFERPNILESPDLNGIQAKKNNSAHVTCLTVTYSSLTNTYFLFSFVLSFGVSAGSGEMEGLATLSCFLTFFDFFLESSLDGVPSVLVDIFGVERKEVWSHRTNEAGHTTHLCFMQQSKQATCSTLPMHFTLLTSVSGDFSLTAGSSEGEDSSLEVAWLSTEELKKNSGNNVLLWTGRVLVTHIRDGSGTGDGARVVV